LYLYVLFFSSILFAQLQYLGYVYVGSWCGFCWYRFWV